MYKITLVFFLFILICSFKGSSNKLPSLTLFSEVDSVLCKIELFQEYEKCEISIRNIRASSIVFDTFFQEGIQINCNVNDIEINAHHFGNTVEDRTDFHEEQNDFVLNSGQIAKLSRKVDISEGKDLHFSFFACEFDSAKGIFVRCVNFELASFDYGNCK